MDKKTRINKIKDEFYKGGKQTQKNTIKLKKQKVRRNFYITKYADRLLREYKEETGVPMSASIELLIRNHLKEKQINI